MMRPMIPLALAVAVYVILRRRATVAIIEHEVLAVDEFDHEPSASCVCGPEMRIVYEHQLVYPVHPSLGNL